MKKLIIGILLMVYSQTWAQVPTNCVTPISNFNFQQKLASIISLQGDNLRLNLSLKTAKENCLSTSQVKDIAVLFEDDYNRLAFVQEAYNNTTDKDNFYDVYNTFLYFSTVFRLHDYVLDSRTAKTVNNIAPVSNVMTFPDIQYPDYRKYYGKTGCMEIISDSEFLDQANKVFNSKTDESKLYIAKNIVLSKCFVTAQAMKMASLLNPEIDRLDFLRAAYKRVYDPDNFKYADPLFKNETYKKEISKLIGGSSAITIADPPCEVSTSEFQAAKTQINKESFNNTKINLAKQIIKTKKCFKTAQIIELLKLFAPNDAKMDIAKYSYDFTTDKENYYKIADSFTFTSDKDAFLKFLKTK